MTVVSTRASSSGRAIVAVATDTMRKGFRWPCSWVAPLVLHALAYAATAKHESTIATNATSRVAHCTFVNDTDLSVPGQSPTGGTPNAAGCCTLCQGKGVPFFVWAEKTSKCYCKAPPFDRHASPGNVAGRCGALPMPPPGPPHNTCPAGQHPCRWPKQGCCTPPPPPPPPPVPPSPPGPNSYACQPGQIKSLGLPFCDSSKSFTERADDLVDRLSLQEKLALLHAKPGTDGCAFEDSGVPRLDIPVYAWTEEANTGADSSCLGPGRCVTTFPSPANLAASYNRSLWRTKGMVISEEIRALNNVHGHRGCGPPAMIGINEWGPNINLIRDQRFGRNSELPSADPFLTGSYAVEYVRGLQRGPDPKYVKIQATLKHYTAYSVESNRGHDNANISAYDMTDSFLRQYEMGFVEGNASGAMCSYNLIDGIPNCASPMLLNGQIRQSWGRDDALIVSDCGALGNMRADPTNWSPEEVVANSFNAGLDLNTGNFGKDGFRFNETVQSAIAKGMLNLSTLNTALHRSIITRMKAGAFDPIDNQMYTRIGADVVNSSEHAAANLDAASQGLVLLRNTPNASGLPLSNGKRLAVVGPHAVSTRGLFSDYYGDQICYDPSNWASRDFSCVPTLGSMLTRYNRGGETRVELGVAITGGDTTGVAAALNAVRWADAVVLAVGTDTISVEHEGTDRREVGLPGGATGPQHNFSVQVLQAAAAAKIPVVLVLCNGGAVSIDTLLLSSTSPAAAIEAFFPGFRGAEAIARHVFGLDNRWGRLPYDILSSTTAQSYDLTDYSMHNRSYRYLPPTSEAVTYPFGWGLSLSSFTLEMAIKPDLGNQTVCVRATNTGQMAGDVVIMAYFRPVTASAGKSSRKLLKQLWEFRRLMLQPRARADVFFEVTPEDLQLVNEAGQRVVTKGSYELSFSIGDGSEDVKYQFHV